MSVMKLRSLDPVDLDQGFWSVKECAAFFGVHPDTVRNIKELPFTRIGGQRRYPVVAVKAYAQRRMAYGDVQ